MRQSSSILRSSRRERDTEARFLRALRKRGLCLASGIGSASHYFRRAPFSLPCRAREWSLPEGRQPGLFARRPQLHRFAWRVSVGLCASNCVFKPTAIELLRSNEPSPSGGGLTRR